MKSGAAIAFNNVSFRYPGGRSVFERFNLRLQPGQRVGLVGESGGGKSTLFALLQRFYDPERGSITIDGQDVSRVTQQSLRDAISVVPQDISLFHRSILENIRYGRPTATDDEVLRAAIAARCDFVESLPEGLATMVGDRGVKISGGQRQRIAIARAFLKDAPILLLDEATAALDSESEEAIREALGRLMRGRTVIAIAHRLATLRNFDRVVVLKNGKIIEDGAPDRLMQGHGPYRELVTQEMSRLAIHAAERRVNRSSCVSRRSRGEGNRQGTDDGSRSRNPDHDHADGGSRRGTAVLHSDDRARGAAAPHAEARRHVHRAGQPWRHRRLRGRARRPVQSDTRYLARLELVLNDMQPLLLGSNLRDDNSGLTVDLTNPDIYRRRPDRPAKGHAAHRAHDLPVARHRLSAHRPAEPRRARRRASI